MKYCKDIFNVHTCISEKPIVNEDYGPAHGLTDSSRTLTRINHYITRSEEDYRSKIEVGKKAGFDNWSMNRFDEVNKNCTFFDDILKDWDVPNRGHHYGVDGWFNFESLYDDMVARFKKGVFVEVGCWKGRSTIYMADQIRGKKRKFYAVDIWEPFRQEDGILFHSPMEEFLRNIEPVKDLITPIKGSSHDVYSQFEDESIDFLFIDANHDYEYVVRDFNNAVDHATNWILIHDMIPKSAKFTQSKYCSDSFRVLQYLITETNFEIYTMDNNFGLTFVKMPAGKINPPEHYSKISYDEFVEFISKVKLYSDEEIINLLRKQNV
jgi:hypothetical protein